MPNKLTPEQEQLLEDLKLENVLKLVLTSTVHELVIPMVVGFATALVLAGCFRLFA